MNNWPLISAIGINLKKNCNAACLVSESEDVDDEGNPISEDGSAPDGSRKRFKRGEVVKKVRNICCIDSKGRDRQKKR